MKKVIYIILGIFISKIIFEFYINFTKTEKYFQNTYIEERLTSYIISINDLKYKINIEGNIDINTNHQIKIPYYISSSKKVDLDEYKQVVTLNNNYSSENEHNAKLILSYPKQFGLSGNGYINATLEIDDKESSIHDNKFKTKQLEIEKDDGYTLAEFTYPRNFLYNQYGVLEIKVISGIKDKMYKKRDNAGNIQSHNFVYYPIVSPITGKIWLNNNLGAKYSDINNIYLYGNLFKQAKSIVDVDAYGNLFQWGRKSDGHEFRNKQELSVNMNYPSDNPTHNFHIISNKYPFDWRVNKNDKLWDNVDSINNVCPNGWRLPTKVEFENEFNAGLILNDNNNDLKLTMAGYKLNNNSSSNILCEGLYGNYWTKDVSNSYAYFLIFNPNYKGISTIYKTAGFSVRCIKD